MAVGHWPGFCPYSRVEGFPETILHQDRQSPLQRPAPLAVNSAEALPQPGTPPREPSPWSGLRQGRSTARASQRQHELSVFADQKCPGLVWCQTQQRQGLEQGALWRDRLEMGRPAGHHPPGPHPCLREEADAARPAPRTPSMASAPAPRGCEPLGEHDARALCPGPRMLPSPGPMQHPQPSVWGWERGQPTSQTM